MGETNYQKGARKERAIVNKARGEGKLSFRSAGSHSPIDVIIVDKLCKVIKLIQSKPNSMSNNAKKKLLDSLSYLNGVYRVEVSVE